MAGNPYLPEGPRDRERKVQQYKERSELGNAEDAQITFAQGVSFIDNKLLKTRDIFTAPQFLTEVYKELGKSENSTITIQEIRKFIKDLEKKIRDSMATHSQSKEELTKQLDLAKQRMVAANATEKLTSVGIMEESQLVVNVKTAKDLPETKIPTQTQARCIVSCQNQVAQTSFVSKETSNSYVWNEVFSFLIQVVDQPMAVQIQQKDQNGDEVNMELYVKLQMLRDQVKHEEIFELKTPEGDIVGRLQLGLQWLWSKVAYFDTISKQLANDISVQQDSFDSLEKQLNTLQLAFDLSEEQTTPADSLDLLTLDEPEEAKVSQSTLASEPQQISTETELIRTSPLKEPEDILPPVQQTAPQEIIPISQNSSQCSMCTQQATYTCKCDLVHITLVCAGCIGLHITSNQSVQHVPILGLPKPSLEPDSFKKELLALLLKLQ